MLWTRPHLSATPMEPPMPDPKLQQDRELLAAAESKGAGAKFAAYFKLSGPGWLQSAITLGGLSLATGLSLGIVGGYKMLWLQPLAMLLGIVMLGTIAYVTLSTGKSPFHQINRHLSPVLGWGWLVATVMANCLWTMPQFKLAWESLNQALVPGLPDEGVGKVAVIAVLALICIAIVLLYDAPGKGVKIFETILKIMVGLIVIAFIGAVVMLTVHGQLNWGQLAGGFIPDPRMLANPAPGYDEALAAISPESRGYWEGVIVDNQRNKVIAAAAVAVGVNMTFLLPYSMLRKGWDRTFRGLARFDLSTGLLIPFVVATSCIVIAAGAQFHAKPAPGLLGEVDASGQQVEPAGAVLSDFNKKLDARLGAAGEGLDPEAKQAARDALPEPERRMAAMLAERKFADLAQSLAPFTGERPAQLVFGLGVLAMAISTAIILMLINGLALCVALGNKTYTGTTHRIGAIIPAVTGAMGPFFWGALTSATDIATITATVGMILLPIAYIAFVLLINNRKVMGDDKPTGGKAAALNAVLIFTVALVSVGAVRAVWQKMHWTGIGLMLGFVVLAAVVPLLRKPATEAAA